MPESATYRREDLGYVSRLHPGESLGELRETLARFVQGVRQARGLERLTMDLWLPAEALRELLQDPALPSGFRAYLDFLRIDLGGLHGGALTAGEGDPDWSEPGRLAYTLDQARQLAAALPPGRDTGQLTTLALGDRAGWDAQRQEAALGQLCRLTGELADLARDTGKTLRACLEPEPGRVLERADDAIALFRDELPAAVRAHGLDPDLIGRHLGVCYDLCAQAALFEHPGEALARLAEAGVPIGKIQIGNALEVAHPGSAGALANLTAIGQPADRTPVRTRDTQGQTHAAASLAEAMSGGLSTDHPWRVGLHVPLQTTNAGFGHFTTTQALIEETLAFLAEHPDLRPTLEVEVLSWDILPAEIRPNDFATQLGGLVAELAWLERAMDRHGLLAT